VVGIKETDCFELCVPVVATAYELPGTLRVLYLPGRDPSYNIRMVPVTCGAGLKRAARDSTALTTPDRCATVSLDGRGAARASRVRAVSSFPCPLPIDSLTHRFLTAKTRRGAEDSYSIGPGLVEGRGTAARCS
jgi:hypothetical protein